jgi:hypothetical protein
MKIAIQNNVITHFIKEELEKMIQVTDRLGSVYFSGGRYFRMTAKSHIGKIPRHTIFLEEIYRKDFSVDEAHICVTRDGK